MAAQLYYGTHTTVLNPSVGSLLFEIISAANLPAVDSGSADPFVAVTGSDGLNLSGFNNYFRQTLPVSSDTGVYKHNDPYSFNRTNYIPCCLNPTWNCRMELCADSVTGCIVFGVWDYNHVKNNKSMGNARLPVSSVVGEGAKITHNLPLSSGGTLLVKVNWVPAEMKSENPIEEIAVQPPGSFQFKVFSSMAGRSPVTDMINCNTQARDWLNAVREHIEFIKIDNENDATMASAVVWYRPKGGSKWSMMGGGAADDDSNTLPPAVISLDDI